MRFFPLLFLVTSITGTSPSWEKIGLYLSVALTSSIKFLIGLLAAIAIPKFGFWDILISAGGGALAGAWVFTLFGAQISAWFARYRPRKKAGPNSFARKRKWYVFWKRYGLFGAVVLAPLISPMVSVGLALAFRERPARILIYISASIIFYSLVFAIFKNEFSQFVAGA